MEGFGKVKTYQSVRLAKKTFQSKLSLVVRWPSVYCTLVKFFIVDEQIRLVKDKLS